MIKMTINVYGLGQVIIMGKCERSADLKHFGAQKNCSGSEEGCLCLYDRRWKALISRSFVRRLGDHFRLRSVEGLTGDANGS